MIDALREKYHHFDVSGIPEHQVVAPSDIGVRAMKLQVYADSLSDDYEHTLGHELPFTVEQERIIVQVQEFVEQLTGLSARCDIRKIASIPGGFEGKYYPAHDTVVITEPNVGSAYGDDIAFGSVLAHELAHRTSMECMKLLDIEDSGLHAIHTLRPHHVIEVTPSFTSEQLLEEALAEEVAARWRVAFDPRLHARDRDLVMGRNGHAIPVRHFKPSRPIDNTSSDLHRGYLFAAYCAFGVQILSDYTGVDLFQLLIDARHPETHALAGARLVETIDSVEPGLYSSLTSAKYSREAFVGGLGTIKQAIANHAYSQMK